MIIGTTAPPMRARGELDVTPGDEPGWTVTVNQERSASLLVRVWREAGTDEFRARLTSVDTSLDEEGGAELTVGVASSPGEVLTAVGSWLTAFLGAGADPGEDAP